MKTREDEFEDGFSIRTVVGAIFVGVVMMPATIYLGLVAGQNIGPAAEWVTIILFAELARRSFGRLRKQEIYLLFYVASGLTGAGVATISASTAGFGFQDMIWKSYLRSSSAAQDFKIADKIPDWAVPSLNSPAILSRDLTHHDFLKPLLLVFLLMLLGRFTWISIGNLLFRLTSDREKLNFPLAHIAAAGATALAEDPGEKGNWRWRWFSNGTVIGLVFSFFLVGIPAITGIFLSKPLTLFPIPWADFTPDLERFLPGSVVTLSVDLGSFFWGMVIPFYSVVGNAVGILGTMLLVSPLLYHFGFYPSWRPGGGALSTDWATAIDFWFSAIMGFGIAFALIGLYQVFADLAAKRGTKTQTAGSSFLPPPPPGRGDYTVKLALLAFFISALGSIVIAHKLLPLFPLVILIVYALVVTPLSSYVDARIRGMTGGGFDMPGIQFNTVRMSGYTGVDFWFAPLPLSNYGFAAQLFKALELTKTKFTSVLKAELLIFPLSALCGYGFWSFFWKLAPIPSAAYPYVAKMWPIWVQRQAFFIGSMTEKKEWLMLVWKPHVFTACLIVALVLYILTRAFKVPVLFYYGLVSSLGGFPSSILFTLAGAMMSRYILPKRYGPENWRKYAPVLAAGFACGMGLVGMLAVGLTLIMKAVVNLPF